MKRSVCTTVGTESKGIVFPLGFAKKIYVGGRNLRRDFRSLRLTIVDESTFVSPADKVKYMTEYEKIYNFQNLYKAHTVARRSKRGNREVIEFEMNLAENLTTLSASLQNGTYKISGYYNFKVYDPKMRDIYALHYRDRVVQHCLCDEVLAPILDKKLIYDNAACRIGKGTHFAIRRLSRFIHNFYNKYGTEGYFLKCDISKFFDNIDHDILKMKLKRIFTDQKLLNLLYCIIDSYETSPNKGLPLGNQTSQWFAIYYLDGFDRLIKEKLKIKYYTRYMDDCVLIHHDKEYLKQCLKEMTACANDIGLELNDKTKIFPIKNGVNYLGWHFYLSDSGKIIRKVRQNTKYKYKRKLKMLQKQYSVGKVEITKIVQVLSSYHSHLNFGHTYKLRKSVLGYFILKKKRSKI